MTTPLRTYRKGENAQGVYYVDFRSHDPSGETPRLEDEQTIDDIEVFSDDATLSIVPGPGDPGVNTSVMPDGKRVQVVLDNGTVGTATVTVQASVIGDPYPVSIQRSFSVEIFAENEVPP